MICNLTLILVNSWYMSGKECAIVYYFTRKVTDGCLRSNAFIFPGNCLLQVHTEEQVSIMVFILLVFIHTFILSVNGWIYNASTQ